MSVSFEQFIMQCCKAEESELRKWMRRVMPRYGFSIKEDKYLSERTKKNPLYKNVHNMLMVRGNNPRVCLVAHTDVCRDWDSKPLYYGNPHKKPVGMAMVDPVIKTVELEEEDAKIGRRIIQDRTCETQVGGDDRLGVAINAWVGLNTGHDMAILLTTDEERGLQSANEVNFPELGEYDICVEVDRGNHSHELVNKIGGTILCEYELLAELLEIAFDIGKPRRLVQGNGTDVAAMKSRKVIKNAVNMTCGYHMSHGSGANEYIDIEEATDTMKYCSSIVRAFNLKSK